MTWDQHLQIQQLAQHGHLKAQQAGVQELLTHGRPAWAGKRGHQQTRASQSAAAVQAAAAVSALVWLQQGMRSAPSSKKQQEMHPPFPGCPQHLQACPRWHPPQGLSLKAAQPHMKHHSGSGSSSSSWPRQSQVSGVLPPRPHYHKHSSRCVPHTHMAGRPRPRSPLHLKRPSRQWPSHPARQAACTGHSVATAWHLTGSQAAHGAHQPHPVQARPLLHSMAVATT